MAIKIPIVDGIELLHAELINYECIAQWKMHVSDKHAKQATSYKLITTCLTALETNQKQSKI